MYVVSISVGLKKGDLVSHSDDLDNQDYRA